MSENEPSAGTPAAPKWKPIGRIERRVLGVLVEKAKTTPDAYPLTLNSLTNGCNQRSNRDPQMNLEPNQVETALEQLRYLSAAMEISGSGRVAKFRHLIYEWMGIGKTEAAVMAELLLRGSQTVGELRGRAARMAPIPDIAALQPVIRDLIDKGLVVSLSPPGRGQTVTHSLYLPEEMAKIRQTAGTPEHPSTPTAPPTTTTRPKPLNPPDTPTLPAVASSTSGGDLEQMRAELDQLKSDVARLQSDLQDLWSNLK